MQRTRILQLVAALTVLGTLAFAGRAGWAQLAPPETGVPTAKVVRGRVETHINALGELRTTKTTPLTAPPVGGQLRLLSLKPTGTAVAAGDVVMTFDPADQQSKLEEAEALLREADLEIAKLRADAAAQTAKDKVDLLTARFDVQKAELDISGNDLLSAIKARQNELTLEEARRRLAQLEEDIKGHATTNEAGMAVLAEKRNKALLAMDLATKTIDSMTVRAPLDGIVTVNANRDGLNFFFSGMTLPEYRDGDTVSGGRAVAEVLDLRQMELVARVPETDRASVAAGQRATLVLDGPSAGTLPARVTNVGLIRNAMNWGNTVEGPVRLVDVSLALDQPVSTVRPGLTAQVKIASQPLTDVLYVPRQAIFDREGKPTVYVKNGRGFAAQVVTITARSESAVVVKDLEEGTEVALASPGPDSIQTIPARAATAGAGSARLGTP